MQAQRRRHHRETEIQLGKSKRSRLSCNFVARFSLSIQRSKSIYDTEKHNVLTKPTPSTLEVLNHPDRTYFMYPQEKVNWRAMRLLPAFEAAFINSTQTSTKTKRQATERHLPHRNTERLPKHTSTELPKYVVDQIPVYTTKTAHQTLIPLMTQIRLSHLGKQSTTFRMCAVGT